MTSYVETLLVKHVKLSSIDEAKLSRRQATLDDKLSLLRILRDTVGASISKKNKLMEIGLTKGYDKARSYKWENNR